MKHHRFFSSERIIGETANPSSLVGTSLSYPDVSGQWKRVLRLARGEQVILFDGSGYDILCEIQDYQGETAVLDILEVKENSVKAIRKIVLYAALVKKDTFEWIVQKATELGVSDIVPLIAERSEKKNVNTERLEKIIVEAAEQSGRADIPKLHDVVTLKNLFDQDKLPEQTTIVFDIVADKFNERDLPKEVSEKVAVFIGPEGGWTVVEREAFQKKSAFIRSLGPQVLRAETAVVAGLARVVF